MLAPWECVDVVAEVLVPGGVFCAYVATTTQLGRMVETLRVHGGFTEPEADRVADPGLARRGARDPAQARDGRPHRLPDHRSPAGAGRHRAYANVARLRARTARITPDREKSPGSLVKEVP